MRDIINAKSTWIDLGPQRYGQQLDTTETKHMIPQKKAEGLNADHVQINNSNQKPVPQEEVKAQHNRHESKRDIQNLTTLVNSYGALTTLVNSHGAKVTHKAL